MAAVLTFCVTVCIWWVYFTLLEVAPFAPNLGSGQEYIYTHLSIYIGLTFISVGLARATSEAPLSMLSAPTRWLLGVGIALWLTSALALKLVSIKQRPSNLVFGRYLGYALCILLLMGLGASLPPLIVLGALVLILISFTILDVRHWMKWPPEVQQACETPSAQKPEA